MNAEKRLFPLSLLEKIDRLTSSFKGFVRQNSYTLIVDITIKIQIDSRDKSCVLTKSNELTPGRTLKS